MKTTTNIVSTVMASNYMEAEYRVLEVLGGEKACGRNIRPQELINKLSSKRLNGARRLKTEVVSTVLWELIGAGEVLISKDGYVTITPSGSDVDLPKHSTRVLHSLQSL